MGTRATVTVFEDNKPLVTIYRQMDGYLTGLGQDIKDALNGGDVRIGNGYSTGDATPKAFNGMGCMAAYLIGKLKGSDIGSVYIQPAGELKKVHGVKVPPTSGFPDK